MAALAIVSAQGAWRRAGMAAAVTGVDFGEAEKRLDTSGVDLTAMRVMAAEGERGLVSGFADARRNEEGSH